MKKKILLLSVLLLSMFQFVDAASYVSCGGSGNIPSAIPAFIRGVILIIKYMVPLGLILFGGYELLKVVYSNDKRDMDDVVRKLIEKTIAGVAVFFVVAGVQVLVKQTSNNSNISNCVSCSGCVANKTGELPNLGVANDTAIVYSPKKTYVIVFFYKKCIMIRYIIGHFH